jgi:hypothetical protein
MLEVKEAKYIAGYSLEIVFNNGIKKVVDLSNSLNGQVFAPLKDIQFFKQFRINFNTIEWENGADFAPEYLFEL